MRQFIRSLVSIAILAIVSVSVVGCGEKPTADNKMTNEKMGSDKMTDEKMGEN